jgi:DNA-binding response OmpR family regulator
VEVAGDGEAATRRAREGKFDLILLDVMLPRKDGIEVLRELRQSKINTPVLILSARSDSASPARTPARSISSTWNLRMSERRAISW